MNRSVRLESFDHVPVGSGVAIVARSWTHPERGRIDCPAHPMLVAAAERAGVAVRSADLDVGLPATSRAPGMGRLFALSYQAPEKHHLGLAIAAHPTDSRAAAWAREEITRWRPALRTRRVLLLGPLARATAGSPRPASPVTAGVPAQPGVPDALWRACGCPVRNRCDAVKGAAAAVRSYLASGDEVLLVGEPVSPADACVTPTVGQDGGVRTVRSPQDAACLRVRDQNRLAFVVAPGSATDQIAGILGVLRTRFPRLRGQHPDGWCYTMTDLLATSRSVLAESDTVLLAGDAETPHTAAVRASGCGTPAHRIRGLNDLFVHHIDAPTIALTGSHTAVGELVLRVLSGLGPLSTVERTTRTRVGGECVASAVATGNNGAVGRSAD